MPARHARTSARRRRLIGLGDRGPDRLIVSSAIVPLAFVSLVTGLVMSMGTKWGLFRHWWVVVSLVLTILAILVLQMEAGLISRMAGIAADSTTSDEALLALLPTLVHSVGGLVVLLLIQVLNVYKPQGLTPYGWRKQQEERDRRRLPTAVKR